MSNNTPVIPLLRTVFESILEVFLICLAGFILARKGILDKKTQRQLNKLNVSLFTPSLLFSKVAFFLSPAKLKELWIIPIFFVIITLTSMVVAWSMSHVFRLKRSQRNFAMAASMFMNSNSLPIALMQSLVVTVPSLQWGEDDPASARVGRALTYLVLYSTMGLVLRWSYGVRLLSQADEDNLALPTNNGDDAITRPLIGQDETAFPIAPEEDRPNHTSRPGSVNLLLEIDNDDIDNEVASSSSSQYDLSRTATANSRLSAMNPQEAMKRGVNPVSHMFYSFPNSPTVAAKRLSSSTDGGHLPHSIEPEPMPKTQTRIQKFFVKVKSIINKFLEFMTAPLWAAVASLIVACIQPFQHALEEHLQPLKNGLTAAGSCSIPVTLIVLGAYFYTPPDPTETALNGTNHRRNSSSHLSLVGSVRDMLKLSSTKKRQQGDGNRDRSLLSGRKEKARPGEGRAVFVAVASRMLITPMLLLPAMAMSTKFNLQQVFEDPVFVVSNVILLSSPAALTLAQISQAGSGEAFERLISRTIFWSYCIVTPPATIIYVVIGLMFTKLQ